MNMDITDSDAQDRADMARLAAGHDAALNDLMERHAAAVFRFLCRMLNNEDDANDLAQILHALALAAATLGGTARAFDAEVLRSEGLREKTWVSASLRWSRKLAREGASGPTSTAFRDLFAFARAWLGRRVQPLEDDLLAWLGFLNAWCAHPAPFDLLDELSISPSDVARIQGAWAQRIEASDDLREIQPAALRARIDALIADGAFELNLIGQDTTSFGMDIGYGRGLVGMLESLDEAARDHGGGGLQERLFGPWFDFDVSDDGDFLLSHELSFLM